MTGRERWVEMDWRGAEMSETPEMAPEAVVGGREWWVEGVEGRGGGM